MKKLIKQQKEEEEQEEQEERIKHLFLALIICILAI